MIKMATILITIIAGSMILAEFASMIGADNMEMSFR